MRESFPTSAARSFSRAIQWSRHSTIWAPVSRSRSNSSQGLPGSGHERRAEPAGEHRAVRHGGESADSHSIMRDSPRPARFPTWSNGTSASSARSRRGTIVEVNYVGIHGVHLPVILPTNSVPYDPAIDAAVAFANTDSSGPAGASVSRDPAFNSLNMEGTSTYQALQASVRRQYGSNLTFVANYTRSKVP